MRRKNEKEKRIRKRKIINGRKKTKLLWVKKKMKEKERILNVKTINEIHN
jgi:hypothetical protein